MARAAVVREKAPAWLLEIGPTHTVFTPMSRSWFLIGGAAIIVIATGYFIWPAIMMPDWMYDLRYGGPVPGGNHRRRGTPPSLISTPSAYLEIGSDLGGPSLEEAICRDGA